jgi:hypothetical protein
MTNHAFNKMLERVLNRYLNNGQIDRYLRAAEHFQFRY